MMERVTDMIVVTILLIALSITFLLFNVSKEENIVRREVTDTVSTYLDIVTDKGDIELRDYENFLNNLSSTGLVFDVQITVKRKVIYTDRVDYIVTQKLSNVVPYTTNIDLDAGDLVLVEVKAINRIVGTSALFNLTGYQSDELQCSLERVNRN